MNIKSFFKSLLGKIRMIKNHISKKGKNVYIGSKVKVVNGKQIELDDNVQIRPYCDLFATDQIQIGKGCDIGTRNRIVGNVIIENEVLTGPDNYISLFDHKYSDPNVSVMHQGAYNPNNNNHDEIIIGEGSWIGTHCAIIGDVHIGKHCVIAANSVVTKDISDFTMAAGTPAKPIKQYNFSTKSWERV